MRYRIEKLDNGFFRVYDYVCKYDGLYNTDGTRRSGSTILSRGQVLNAIANLRRGESMF